MDCIKTLIAEISATSEYRAACAKDPTWSKQLDGFEAALSALYQASEQSPEAIDLFDRAARQMRSAGDLKIRILAIGSVLAEAHRLIDPTAWGGAKDRNRPCIDGVARNVAN